MHGATAGLTGGLLVVVFLAGLRHGFDIDHVAAITDITSAQTSRRRSLALASVYILGHAVVLVVLGLAAVMLGARVPATIDSVMGRIIGVTLVLLGGYVVYSLVRYRSAARLRSRWMLVFIGVRRALSWLRKHPQDLIEIDHTHEHDHGPGHDHAHPEIMMMDGPVDRNAVTTVTKTHVHTHRHVMPAPADPFVEYGLPTTLAVGMIHGIGAETPSQILLFTTAAGVAGSFGGVALLAAFVGGLFLGNTVLAIASTLGFAGGRRVPAAYMTLAGITAGLSM
ncbi:MAG TPA: hypothetical protein VFK89_10910, partial [Actinomycetota bacterium]|nr:hypothetical protein [Actinomycetota bacterium]